MILIDNVLIQEDVFKELFSCCLTLCRGECCVAGDSGAPLEPKELPLIKESLPAIWDLLSEESRAAILEQDIAVYDADGDLGTPLVNGEACAYAFFRQGVALCSFEQAFSAGLSSFKKPISCHLYPIRIETGQFLSMKYHVWDVCTKAQTNENTTKLPVFQYVKESIIRKFGESFYEQLEEVYACLNSKQ